MWFDGIRQDRPKRPCWGDSLGRALFWCGAFVAESELPHLAPHSCHAIATGCLLGLVEVLTPFRSARCSCSTALMKRGLR